MTTLLYWFRHQHGNYFLNLRFIWFFKSAGAGKVFILFSQVEFLKRRIIGGTNKACCGTNAGIAVVISTGKIEND